MEFSEIKDESIVKSLLTAGLSEDYIMAQIEAGNIKIEKSCKKSEEDCDVDDNDEEEEFKEEEELEKKVSKKNKSKERKDLDEEDLHKALDSYFNSMIENSDFDKRIGSLEKSLEKVTSILKSVAEKAPSFKGANLSGAVLEKSIQRRNDDDTVELSLSRQRFEIRKALSDMIEDETDEEIQKSLISDSKNYLADPNYLAVGETAIKNLQEKKNIKLIK